VDEIRATTAVSLGKGCLVRVLQCDGDAQLAKDCQVELARVRGRIIAEPGAVVAKRD
jgi:hypothetical protein